MSEKNVLKIENVGKTYLDFRLNNISFSLPEGYIMGLVGPNGAGKTTIIKMILDLVKREFGEITVFDKDNQKYRTEILQNIGVVFDNHCFMDEWKAKEINQIYRWFYPQWNGLTFEKYLEKFEISKQKCVKDMSKGMQMKLMIACALSYNAKLLILDEPTSGLDPIARAELIDILGKYVEDGEHSVLFSTHVTEDLEKIADYITYLYKGNLIYSGDKMGFVEKYLKLKGSYAILTEEMKKIIIGIRRYGESFEGMIETNRKDLFNGFYMEAVTIEDVVVFMGRKNYEGHLECN